MKILDLISKPGVSKLPDFTKTAIQFCRTEAKALEYELQNCMNKQVHIRTLESKSLISDSVKNENIELYPGLPIYLKVSIY